MRHKLFTMLACLLLGCSTSLAQSTDAMISGRVLDPQGALVVGATITIINDTTNAERTTTTNGAGVYSIPSIQPGQYHIQVSKPGFKNIIEPHVMLHLQEAPTINFSLELGPASEIVTVQGSGININSTDATVSTLVDAKTVENMPLNGRSFQALILLAPGAVGASPQAGASTIGQAGEFSVNGNSATSNYYTVDGTSANVGVAVGAAAAAVSQNTTASGSIPASTALGTTQALVSVDDMQEFRVQTSSYAPEYGRYPGAQVGIQTKSGTNAYHGDAYDYLRNSYFDANPWFNNYTNCYAINPNTHQPNCTNGLRQNDFGGALGGPIRIPGLYNGKDKTFFFVNYEGLREVTPLPATVAYVPDACLRGTGVCPVGRTAAPAVLLPVMNAFPLPNGTEADSAFGLARFIAGSNSPGTINSTSVRFDQVVNDKMTVFFRFADTNSEVITYAPVPWLEQATPFTVRTYTGGANNIFSSKLSNEFRLNYTSNQVTTTSSIAPVGGNTPINLPEYVGLSGLAITTIAIQDASIGAQTQLGQGGGIDRQQQWNPVDTVSYTAGAHQFKFGVDYRRSTADALLPSLTARYSFRTAASLENNSLSGPQGERLIAQLNYYPIYTNFSLFAQDTWKISNRLTLSYGLRWEVDPAPTVAQGMQPYTLTGTSFTDASPYSLAPRGTPLWQTTWFNFAPRLGAAYVLRDNPGWTTVVRSGVGVFFDTGQQLGSLGFSGPGYSSTAVLSTHPVTFPCPGYPACSLPNFAAPITNPPTAASLNPLDLTTYSPHLQLPYTLEWNVSVEQQLGKSQSFTASYVGSHGARQLDPTTSVSFNPMTQTGTPNVKGIDEVFTVQNGPGFDYDALQLQYQRRFSSGLTATASYTWSHCIGYTQVSTYLPYERGNCNTDVRNSATGALSYNLPNVGENAIVKAVLDHWGLDDRVTVRGGFPIFLQSFPISADPVTGQFISGFYDTINQANGTPIPQILYGANCTATLQNIAANSGGAYTLPGTTCPGGRAINPCAFTPVLGALGTPGLGFATAGPATATYTAGCNAVYGSTVDSGRQAPFNLLRGFDLVQMDIAIRREFPIYNRLKLQFRAEAFNVFNHPNFGTVQAGGPQFGQSTAALNSSLGVLNGLYQAGGPRSMQFALKLIF